MKQRTGYGNPRYRWTFNLDAQHISGWMLFLMVVSAGVFLAIALSRQNGFAKSWGILLAFTITEAVVEAAKRFLINMLIET